MQDAAFDLVLSIFARRNLAETMRVLRPGKLARPDMLHPLEHVGDHQNPLAHTPALTACQAPQLRDLESVRRAAAIK